MARALRIEYAGAVYHIVARGNQGRSIFDDDRDRLRFLDTLGETCDKTGWRIHAFVLMGNHYHLLAETPEANLVAGMKWLQGVYTQRYNRRHEVCGHLFQGRYKAIIIDGEAAGYFDVVGTYIHLNPVRAGLIRAGEQPLRQYRWSSYLWYLQPARAPVWLDCDRVLAAARLGGQSRKGYEAYMESRVLELAMKDGRPEMEEMEEKWKALRRGWYLGEESFLEKLKSRLKAKIAGKKRESHAGGAQRAHGEAAAQELLSQGLDALGISADQLPKMPKGSAEKTVLAWWLRQRTTVSLRRVGEALEMGHYTRVTQAVSRMNRRPTRKMAAIKQRLLKAEK
ncbi:MAG TPA: transposase [Verrucomicrobiae bacterium]|nr:transposase [Verrucomicrobiae bacterium]